MKNKIKSFGLLTLIIAQLMIVLLPAKVVQAATTYEFQNFERILATEDSGNTPTYRRYPADPPDPNEPFIPGSGSLIFYRDPGLQEGPCTEIIELPLSTWDEAEAIAASGDPIDGQLINLVSVEEDGVCAYEDFGQTITISGTETIDDPIDEETSEEALANCTEAGALAWIFCPMISSMLDAVQGMMDLMSTLLQVTPLDTAGGGTNDPVFETWSFMRNIALTSLVFALMWMIFQQAIKPDTDAYLIKRMLPRMGGAAIGIIFSYYIAAILLDLFNLAGSGIQGFMNALLETSGTSLTSGQTITDTIGKGLIAGGTIALLASSTPVIPLLITVLIPVALAVLTAFIVIIVRHVLIIVLVVFAPFAFAAWVLPNTEPWFKKWFSFMSGLLLMYPLVMVLLGSGAIFGLIITGGGGAGSFTSNNVFNYVIALAAIAVTLGLIPFTIRASSSILGRISGAVNNPNRGPIDRIRKGAQQRTDFARNQRKTKRLEDLRSTPGSRPFKRGYLRAMTGEFGYGNVMKEEGRGYQKLHTYAAGEEAFKKQKDIEAFRISDEISKQSDQRGWLRTEFAKEGASEARKSVIFEQMAKMKDLDGLTQIYDTTAKSGNTQDIEALKRMTQANFGTVHEFAPQLTLSNLDAGDKYRPAWEQIGELTPEPLSKLKPESINGALSHAASTGNYKLMENIMRNYVAAQPHMRAQPVVMQMKQYVTDPAVSPYIDNAVVRDVGGM